MRKPTEDELIKMMFPKPLEVKDLPTDKLQELQKKIDHELRDRGSYYEMAKELSRLRMVYREQKDKLESTESEIRFLDKRLKGMDVSLAKRLKKIEHEALEDIDLTLQEAIDKLKEGER